MYVAGLLLHTSHADCSKLSLLHQAVRNFRQEASDPPGMKIRRHKMPWKEVSK